MDKNVDKKIEFKVLYDVGEKKPMGIPTNMKGIDSICICDLDKKFSVINKPQWMEEREAILLIKKKGGKSK